MTKSYTKLKHQVKSSRYYIFWGAATVAVMAGQIYVGNGYRGMSQSVKDLTETITIKMEWDELNKRRTGSPYMPMINPDDYIIWESID
tara:strand:+ start:434 stop:697 length:264 start_codon:yes stop_codon:yes gene_type:complete